MNLTGNGNIRVEDLKNMMHKHSGIVKRQADNYAFLERDEKKDESVRN